MFSTKKQLIKKTGKHGVGRFSFLEQLITEYNTTKSREAKEQVLANLANFAYDPVNYDYLWRLRILDLFFSALEDNNQKIVSFAIAGICNICLEPLSREYILRTNGVQIISSLLSSNEESIILSAITTLIYLDTPDSRQNITCKTNVDRMQEFSKSTNIRIKNLANIFLRDICNLNNDKVPTKSANNIHTSAKKSIKKAVDTVDSTQEEASASENINQEISAITDKFINRRRKILDIPKSTNKRKASSKNI